MTPDAAARLLEAERARITSIIDARIASWETFEADYPDHHEVDLLLAEFDYLKGAINDGANHPDRRTNL